MLKQFLTFEHATVLDVHPVVTVSGLTHKNTDGIRAVGPQGPSKC